MNRVLAILFFVILAGCATLQTADTSMPEVPEIQYLTAFQMIGGCWDKTKIVFLYYATKGDGVEDVKILFAFRPDGQRIPLAWVYIDTNGNPVSYVVKEAQQYIRYTREQFNQKYDGRNVKVCAYYGFDPDTKQSYL